MRPYLSLTFFLLLIVASCRSSSQKALDCAEVKLEESPDLALSQLSALEWKDFPRKKDQARYALLMSAAMDKNYVDVSSDSLTRVAVDYYSVRRNKYYRMLSWYYHGLVLMNARSYSSSIVALEKAERDAVSLNDAFHLGLIFRNKAKVFNLTNNNPEAIACQRKAVHYLEMAGRESYQSFAEVNLAIHYSNNQEYDRADSLFSEIRRKYDNPAILRHCDVCQAGILVETNRNPEEAVSLYRRVPRTHYSLLDYAYLALAHEMLSHRDSADYWMKEGYGLAGNQSDSASIGYLHSQLERMRGHYQQAFHLIYKASAVQDSLTRVLLRQSVSAAQRDYFKSETDLQDATIRTMRLTTLLGTVFALFLASFFAVVTISRSRKKDHQLQEQMARLALQERELERINRDNAHLVGSLFGEKVDHLDRLCESYFREEDVRQKDIVFKQVKALGAKIRKDEGLFLSLERDLDRYCQGIMTKLRQQVPRIKGENLRIIMFYFAGFSYESVFIILNKNSIDSLKTARSRFRREIIEARAPDTALFLKMLEIKKRPQADTNEMIVVR